jgi:hypothetical protein
MRFLIDANLPRAAIDVCQKFGHKVEFALDIGMSRNRSPRLNDDFENGQSRRFLGRR